MNSLRNHQNRRPLVHFVLSLAHANAEAIGLDPTMDSSKDGNSYDITVFPQDGNTRKYRTLGLIAQVGSTLRSRVTRVWKAVRIEDGREVGEPVVLKDTWMDSERSSEGEILSNIVGDLPVEDQDKSRDFFPAIECHGKVYLDYERNALDAARSFTMADPSTEQLPDAQPLWHKIATQKGPVHYRIVFKDVCKPLNKETSLATIFRALSKTAFGAYIDVFPRRSGLILSVPSVASYACRWMGSP